MKEEMKGASSTVSVHKGVAMYAIAAFLVGLFVGWLAFAPASPEGPSEEGLLSDSPLVLSGGNTVTVDDQMPGQTVSLKSVVFEEAGWVAVHEDREGKPGNILGAAWFPGGMSSGEVELLRATTDGGTYYAMLHKDDGDKKFDHTIDTPLTDGEGNPLMVKFMTTATPAVQQ